jgi:hypothetical protein
LRTLFDTVRQWRFPPELRIAEQKAPDGLDEVVEALRGLAAGVRPPGRGDGDDRGDRGERFDPATVAAVATGLWRARRRLVDPATGRPHPEARLTFRHVRSSWDALTEAGVLIQDHDGEAFESGQLLEVIAFQPTPGLSRETVTETIRPSVYLRGRCLQIGQVMVGIPEKDAVNAAETGTETGAE